MANNWRSVDDMEVGSTVDAILTAIVIKLIYLHLLNSYFGFLCYNTVSSGRQIVSPRRNCYYQHS